MTSLCQLRSVVVLLSVSGMAALAGPAAAAHRQPDVKYDLPLAFEANRGQTDAEVKFLSRGRGYMLFLSSTEAVLSLRASAVLRMRFLGADGGAKIAGVDDLPGKSNYFIGRDPAAWRLGVPSYAGVRYEAIYPGVDLLFQDSGQHELEYDFVIGPGADAGIIRLGFEGASRLELDDAGNLVLHTPGGPVIERAPVAYQEIDGTRHAVATRFEIKGKREVAFRVGAYDRERPLVIDPVLSYSTYLGGSGLDRGFDVAVDAAGSAYVTGLTCSTNFPTAHAVQGSNAGPYDVVVAKLSPPGNALAYSTYLGGTDDDLRSTGGNGIAVDASGNAYVVGTTFSNNFPTVNAFQAFRRGSGDAFLFKLGADAPTQCSNGGAASPSIVWSPNHELVPVTITGLTDPDGDAVSVTVDAITQDEPVLGPGTGAICPDATGAGTASPAVRAERSGNDGGADGRVYHIAFTGRDPAGAACSGVATVCVPHDQQAGSTCVDQGPLHDSTQCP